MVMFDEFESINIDKGNMFDKDETIGPNLDSNDYLNVIGGKEILQLKNNCIPKGLVPIEELFDNNDVAKNPKVTANDVEVEDYNIGTEQELEIIKLSKISAS